MSSTLVWSGRASSPDAFRLAISLVPLSHSELAVAHDCHTLGVARENGVVGHQHQSEVMFMPEPFQQRDDLVARVTVEVARRLVG
ncbi:MAG TPA: hypothetical protein VHZ51_29045, partial [Ktedonobacteraceae bacterium]|nr:hypothetical protein [Ktedonobacteraceae bacterium]